MKSPFYDKKDHFNFPIVNFPSICSNIPAPLANGVHVSQLMRYSRACDSFHDLLDRGLLLTGKQKGYQKRNVIEGQTLQWPKEKRTNNNLQNTTQKTKDRATIAPLKPEQTLLTFPGHLSYPGF
jgi:hypothetical protein